MGYFSNGSEGMEYQGEWCENCIHNEDCAVLKAHMIYNYDECNKADSILHILIPRDEKGYNKQCTMFIPIKEVIK